MHSESVQCQGCGAERHHLCSYCRTESLVRHPQHVACRACGERHRITRIEAVAGSFRMHFDCFASGGENSIEWKAQAVAEAMNARTELRPRRPPLTPAQSMTEAQEELERNAIHRKHFIASRKDETRVIERQLQEASKQRREEWSAFRESKEPERCDNCGRRRTPGAPPARVWRFRTCYACRATIR